MENVSIVPIITTIGGLAATYVKIYFDQRKNNKNITTFIKERLNGLEDKFNRFAMDFNAFRDDNIFRLRLRNAIAERASTILNSSHSLKDYSEYNSVLMDWVQYTQDFAVKYWYSNYRQCNSGKEQVRELREYIELDLMSALNNFESDLKNNICGEKMFVHGNKRLLFTFADFIKTQKCYTISELLLIELVRNGLEQNKFIQLFDKYTADFIHSFIDTVISWRNLPNYDDIISKEMDKM